jgi:Dockerin type I domain
LSTPPFQSNFNADGTITIYVPKSAFGNPQPGALLGAVNGRTITGDAPGSPESKLERSNAFTDHTFVKAQTDSSFPASTYTVLGNSACNGGGIAPVGAVSRKTHDGAGDFDIDLPLTGNPGIECRTGPVSGSHTVVVTFPVPVTVASTTCAGNSATFTGNGTSVITVNCTGVPDQQTIGVNLASVSDGVNTANVSIPMGVLLGDVNGNGVVTTGDVSLVKTQVAAGGTVTPSNFRDDVNANGIITTGDVSITKTQVAAGAQLH